MNFDAEPSTAHIEKLLTALPGVMSARIVRDDGGQISEVHVLASHEIHPKQIVRNVESALTAGIGLTVDRRIISVAQLRPDASAEAVSANLADEEDEERAGRFLLVGYETSSVPPLDTTCIVTIAAHGRQFAGTASGAATPAGRAEAAAKAALEALTAASPAAEAIGIEGVAIIETNTKPHVLVSAFHMKGRTTTLLTGISPLGRSPEEAGILAALQATNRWVATN